MNKETETPADLEDGMGDVIAEIRDKYPRKPNDADSGEVAEGVLEYLVTRSFREQAEGALRWLDPSGDIQDRLGLDPRANF